MGEPRSQHIPELQSLRGLAALVVVLSHCVYAVTLSAVGRAASEVPLNAHAAVCCFFVLSGYVLARSLASAEASLPSIARFYVRRSFRIAPALWVTSGLTVLYLFALHYRLGPVDASPWFTGLYPAGDFRPVRVLTSAMTLNGFLSPTYWSLFVELVGSALLPWIVMAARRSPILFWIVTSGLVVLALTKGAALHMSCGVYLASFAFGTSVLLWGRRVGELVRSNAVALMIALVCLVVMGGFRHLGPWAFERAYHAAIPTLVESGAAMVLVALIVTRPEAFALLRWRPIVGLGDVSYSLYLLHFVVLVALVKLTAGWLLTLPALAAAAALAAMVLGLALPLSVLSYRYVELPGITLGRRALDIFRLGRPAPALA